MMARFVLQIKPYSSLMEIETIMAMLATIAGVRIRSSRLVAVRGGQSLDLEPSLASLKNLQIAEINVIEQLTTAWTRKEVVLRVPEMMCPANCGSSVLNAIRALEGVEAARLRFEHRQIVIRGDMNVDAIRTAVSDIGFDSEVNAETLLPRRFRFRVDDLSDVGLNGVKLKDALEAVEGVENLVLLTDRVEVLVVAMLLNSSQLVKAAERVGFEMLELSEEAWGIPMEVVPPPLGSYYVSTQVSSDRKTLLVDLLQCQLLSLVGVMPEEQILMSSSGEILYSPSISDVTTIAVSTKSRLRFFLFASSESSPEVPEVASDWRQICTKSTIGDAAVVQPAFRKILPSGGDPLATLICEPCARTCTTDFQPVSPLEWNACKTLTSRFISDVTVVAGDVDVAAPSGPRALTQLHVLFGQRGGDTADLAGDPEKVVEVDCNVPTDSIGASIRIGYDSVQLKGNMEQLETLAITDIVVVVGDQPAPSSEYIKITRNLNKGAVDSEPVFLYYRLSPLGGFVCDSSREHSEFGECLFAARHLTGVKSILDLKEPQLSIAQTTLAAERRRGDMTLMDAHYRQHQPGMLKRLQSGLQRAQSYENKQMHEEALKRIPVETLHERARSNPSPMPLYQDELVKHADEIRKKKNRVSAQRDRDRKKQHVQDLEDMVCELWKRVQYLEGIITSMHPNQDVSGLYQSYEPYAVSRNLQPLTGAATSGFNEVDMTELAWLLDSIPMDPSNEDEPM
ncbi:hypothetical protein JG687_00011343 [Phytophthora cactorum]|uniref:HMA domain-containing protein n=1 Tax=Phytophthora cactorum TaxID=29920 RepID=A0A8T1U8R2_9STRA|nr:hypothetical protein JG687_00011343 [Phytophthora cactorum]